MGFESRPRNCTGTPRYSLCEPNPVTSAAYIGAKRVEAVSFANRGLAYGDGLFETMRVHRGGIPLWPRHLARLCDGARRLGISLPETGFLEAQVRAFAGDVDGGVLKLLLTRGDGGRGYAPPADTVPTWMLSRHPLPPPLPGALRLHDCATRLAIQPALAGLKHCNRLEQVLARGEVERAACDEGLMRDMESVPVCATAANLLVLQGGRWTTPAVSRCGVAGVLRGWLLDAGLVEEAPVTGESLDDADALALCNAVRGILPVASLGTRRWVRDAAEDRIQERLAMAFPMFSEAGQGT